MNYEKLMVDFALSMAFSLFGMLLIFGLGFVFPTIDPYVVIKWIVVVAAAVFLYSILSYFIAMFSSGKKGKKK